MELISKTGGEPILRQTLKSNAGKDFTITHYLYNHTNRGWVERPFPQVYDITLLNGWKPNNPINKSYYSIIGDQVCVVMEGIINPALQDVWGNEICHLPPAKTPVYVDLTVPNANVSQSYVYLNKLGGLVIGSSAIPANTEIRFHFTYIKDG